MLNHHIKNIFGVIIWLILFSSYTFSQTSYNIDITSNSEGKSNTSSSTDHYSTSSSIDTVSPNPTPKIDIEVSTNGSDADTPTGPKVDVDSIVTWEYVVKNIGNVELKDVVITDSKLSKICTVKTLSVGETGTCSQTGITIEGQYSNTGTVKGKSPSNVEVEDSDKSHYFGKQVVINFPVAKDDKKEGENGNPVIVDVLINDKGIESELNAKSVLFTDSNSLDNGKRLVVDGEGVWSINKTTGHITFTPQNAFRDNPTPVMYTVEDMNGNLSNKAVVSILYPKAEQASLGNFVWFDADKNGKQDQGESGLGGITVELYNALDELNQTVVTDENGSYNFVNLDAGEYSLKFVVQEGYTLTTPNVDALSDELDSDADKLTGKTEAITLTEGENNVSFDAGMYITPKPSIDVVKTTNHGNVANIVVGDTVTWKYVITNTGNSILTDINVQDDKEGLISNCQGDGSLELLSPKQSITCTKSGVAILGAYSNTVVVEAKSDDDTSLQDTDSSSYVGQSAPVELIKVGDYIWLDSNRNGIQDDTELPLKDISVQLYNADKKLISTTKSNADGIYSFNDVEPGQYYLKFGIPSGYSVSKKGAGSNKEKDSNVYVNGKTPIFTLIEGKDDLTIDLGLHPTLTNLGDRVFLDRNANGIQDADENSGVANITVKLYNANNTFVEETKTTSTGYYLFRNLVPANYYIIFEVPSTYKVSPKDKGSNESADSDANGNGKTDVIRLIGGQDNKSVDMGLYQEGIKLGDRVFYDINKNGLQDPGETGVADVKVVLYKVGQNDPVAETKTSASGLYRFDNVDAGEYYIQFRAPAGYTVTKRYQGAKDKDSDPDASGRTDNFTLVVGTQDSTIDMGIYQNVVSYGDRVFLDTNLNGLQDIDEKGVRDINVTIYSENSDFSRSMLTDENGNYLFRNLSAGEYYAEFRDIPYGHLITKRDVNNNESDLKDSDAFEEDKRIVTEVALLTPGKNDLSWDLGIYKTVCLPGKSVVGNLVFEDFNKNGIQDIGERGVANVKVALYNNDTEEKVKEVKTDINGLYEFTHVDPEFNYYIQFTVPNGFVVSPQDQDEETIDSDADETGKTDVIVLEADQINSTVDMGIFREGSAIGDRVFFDDLNGISNGIQDEGELGAHDVKVTLYSVDGTELNSTRTNVSGEYHFTNIPQGRYIVGFSELPAGYIFTQEKQGVDSEKDSDVNSNGKTDIIFVDGKVNITSIDAGLKKVHTGMAANDIKRGITGENVTLDVLANDAEGTFSFDVSTVRITSVPNGATLSDDGRALTVPGEGVWRVDPDTGAITFTPYGGFVGDPTSISYSVQDRQGNETGADVEINYPPVANDDNVNAEVAQQVIVYVLENDSNTSSPLDPASLRFIDPSSGDEVETVSIIGEGTWNTNIDGTVTFVPEDGFENNPTPILYIVRELAGDISNRATITIAYPDAVDDVVILPVEVTGDVVINVSENDSNNTLPSTVTIGCEEEGVKALVVPREGRWSVDSEGVVTFSPEGGFIGEPKDIQYTVGLVTGERSNCATVDIRRELLAVDDETTLNVGSATLVSILSNDFGSLNAQSVNLLLPLNSIEGSTVNEELTMITVPREGVWSVNDLGIVSFVPIDGFSSAPTPIRYTVENNNGLVSNIATMTLIEGGVSIVANDDIGEANGPDPVRIHVLDNDSGDINRSSVRIVTPSGDEVLTYVVPGEGIWHVGEDGSITFTGEIGFVGTPTPIRYIIDNNSIVVLSDTATVSINGTCVCKPYETSIPAMGQLATLLMLISTLLISMFFLRKEHFTVK